jgi:methylmalonyl-CoA mutase
VSEKLNLAAEFPAARHEAWLKLVDKALAGAPFDKKLVSRTYDGIAVQPLYTRSDARQPDAATRGTLTAAHGEWDVRQSIGTPSPAEANAHILEELEAGATSISLRVDPEGGVGVAVHTLADLERTLDSVMLDIAPVALDAYVAPLPYAPLLAAVLEKQNVTGFAGNFGIDPLSTLAGRGRLPADTPTALACTADAAAYVAKAFPRARAITVNAQVYHAAGGSEGQELGAGVATAVAYLRAMTDAGMSIDAACDQIAFTIAVDADFFLSIAKIRALRKLWSRVTEVCGASPRSAPVTAQASMRMMSRRDPHVNMLRGTVACFAGGIAGADAVTVLPFDAARGTPGTPGRRIARNTQLVLLEEAHLARVIDPAGGAWMFEALTEEVAEKAWAFFQEIEKRGGMAEALLSGFVGEAVGAVTAERRKNISKRKDALTGVSEFPNIHEANLPTRKPWPATRPEPTGDVSNLPAPGNGAFMAALVEAAKKGANLTALIKAAARPNPAVLAKPLAPMRLAEGFERLRDAGDAFRETYGQRPRVFLANIGTAAAFTPRATFAKNFFEAGGIETAPGPGGNDVEMILRDFKASGAPFAVICATDAAYAEKAADVAKALKGGGAVAVYLAGRGGELEGALRTAGVDAFIFIGCDAESVLADAHARLQKP